MSVYKRDGEGRKTTNGSGRWWFDFSYQKQRYKEPLPTAKNRNEARAMEAVALRQVHDGVYVKPKEKTKIARAKAEALKPLTFSEFVRDTYLPTKKEKDRVRSYHGFVIYAETFMSHFKDKPLAAITAKDVDDFHKARATMPTIKGTPRKQSTIKQELKRLKSIFIMACEKGHIQINPCAKLKLPQVNDQRTRILKPHEEAKFFNAFSGVHYAKYLPIVKLAFYLGMRLTEIVKLEWREIDFETGNIILLKKDGRTKTGDREITLSKAALEILRELYANKKHPVRVFHGRGLTPNNVSMVVAKRCDSVGLSDMTLHTMRHTCITRMIEAGVNLIVVAAQVGHTDVKMTQRYSHISNEAKRAAAEKVTILEA